MSVFLRSHDIMTPITQMLHYGQGEILVRVEQHRHLLHNACFARLILPDFEIDFGTAAAYSHAASRSAWVNPATALRMSESDIPSRW